MVLNIYLSFWQAMIPGEITLDILQALPRNELEKCQLVAGYYRRFVEENAARLTRRHVAEVCIVSVTVAAKKQLQ